MTHRSAAEINLARKRRVGRRRLSHPCRLGRGGGVWRRRPGKINEVREWLSRKTFDVTERSKGEIFFSRRMTTKTIETKACVRHRVRRIVIIDDLIFPDLGPIPAVL